ncbi:response regulator [Sulfurovum sp. CS9]|uniref:response regulator n=1 Tax=Sulfurovum sp. CS9 TaxID=3391146 RepID=UPI0039E837A8
MLFPKNIVIVEDETITQRYLQDIFAQYDVTVSGCFDNAEDTIEALKNIDCDMILMDINIKGPVDGIQLAKDILKTYDFPIVFITAHNDDETFQEVLELSPYGFIEKPFSKKDIVFTLQLAYQRYLSHEKENKVESVNQPREYLILNEHYAYSRALTILYYDDQPVKLSSKQSKLLEVLIQNVNHTVDYDALTSAIWGNDTVADSALRTLVYSIRKTLPNLPLLSYSKIGYSIEINTSN